MCVVNKIRLCRDHPCYRIADVYIQHNKQFLNRVGGGADRGHVGWFPKNTGAFYVELVQTIILNRFKIFVTTVHVAIKQVHICRFDVNFRAAG